MTREQLDSILKIVGAKTEKDGASVFPEGASATVHIAHNGTGQAFPKVESVRVDGELVVCRAAKQTLVALLADVFAVSVDGAPGQPARKPPGFG